MEIFTSTGDWIVAMGKTIIHSLWMGLLVISFLKLILDVIPDSNSKLRYRIAISSMLLLLGSVIVLFFKLYSPAQPALLFQGSGLSESLFRGIKMGSLDGSGTSDYKDIYLIICCIYIVGIPISGIRSLGLFHYQVRMKRSGTPVQGYWRKRFFQLKNSLGINRRVEIMESGMTTMPILLGFLRPVVMVPAGFLSTAA